MKDTAWVLNGKFAVILLHGSMAFLKSPDIFDDFKLNEHVRQTSNIHSKHTRTGNGYSKQKQIMCNSSNNG